jgi:apolipoprotein N-acyltransferase
MSPGVSPSPLRIGISGSATGAGPLLPMWAAVPAAAASGLMLDGAFPAVGWWVLAWAGVLAVLASLVGRSAGGALLVGLVFGAVFYLTHLIWVGRFLGPVPWLALAGLETVLVGLGSVLIAAVYRWSETLLPGRCCQLLLVPVLVAGSWTLRELVMGVWPYSGFPWARLAMSQVDGPAAEAVSWVGVTGVSFLMVLVCAAALQGVLVGGLSDVRAATTPRAVVPTPTAVLRVAPAAALAAALVLVPQFPTTPDGDLTVGWVQGNGPAAYFDDRSAGDVLAAQTAASAAVLGQDMDLLVWPEGGVDSDPLNDAATAARLDDLVRRAGAPMLVNAATRRGAEVFNTSLLWTAGGATQLHDKVNPVPFGEYVPDRWFYQRIVPDLVGLIQRDYTPGVLPPMMSVDGVGLGLAICFDVIYDDVIWDGARLGAGMYVFQTNNADFRGSDENLQQLAFARMRAIETGRAVVNVSTVGTSQVIGPDGAVLDAVGVDRAAARVTTVPVRTGLTPATVLGPWIAGILGGGSLLAMVGLAVSYRWSRRATTARGWSRRAATVCGELAR